MARRYIVQASDSVDRRCHNASSLTFRPVAAFDARCRAHGADRHCRVGRFRQRAGIGIHLDLGGHPGGGADGVTRSLQCAVRHFDAPARQRLECHRLAALRRRRCRRRRRDRTLASDRGAKIAQSEIRRQLARGLVDRGGTAGCDGYRPGHPLHPQPPTMGARWVIKFAVKGKLTTPIEATERADRAHIYLLAVFSVVTAALGFSLFPDIAADACQKD